jgi:hypothetical protein
MNPTSALSLRQALESNTDTLNRINTQLLTFIDTTDFQQLQNKLVSADLNHLRNCIEQLQEQRNINSQALIDDNQRRSQFVRILCSLQD